MNMYLPPGPRSGMPDEMSAEHPPELSAGARALLTALKMRGVGPVAVRKLAAQVQQSENIEPTALWFSGHGITVTEGSLAAATDSAVKVIEACRRERITVLSMLDAAYPERLKRISDAPPILYVKGETAALQGDCCAVVGTRHASDNGMNAAYKISMRLSMRGINVVSGLALGIDTAAHRGALDADSVTVAVMAHGLDIVAPTSNKKLAARILDQGGVLISEHEPKVPPRPAEFVRRNRIQSGMSLCSIIVESGEVGGTMHQARFTRDQGKPVLAILPENADGPLPDFNHAGGRLLVREHAAITIRNAEELMPVIDRLTGSTEPSAPQEAFGF